MTDDKHKNNDEDYTLVWRTPSPQKREAEVMENIANIVNENEIKRKSFSRRQYKKKETLRKRRRKDRAVGAVAGSLATLMLIGGVKLGINLKEKYDFHSDLKKAKAELCEELTTKLANEGLDIDTLKIEDIPTDDISEEELYTYYCLLGYEDCNEIAKRIGPLPNDPDQTSGYVNGLINVYSRLGYFSEEGKPSTFVWENHMDSSIVEDYRNGTLTLEEGRSKNAR